MAKTLSKTTASTATLLEADPSPLPILENEMAPARPEPVIGRISQGTLHYAATPAQTRDEFTAPTNRVAPAIRRHVIRRLDWYEIGVIALVFFRQWLALTACFGLCGPDKSLTC